MAYILHDFTCTECSTEWEDLVDRSTPTSVCPNCGAENDPSLSAPNLGAFSMMDKVQKAEHLKQRSEKHTRGEVRKEPERWGELGKQRARAGTTQVGYTGKK